MPVLCHRRDVKSRRQWSRRREKVRVIAIFEKSFTNHT
jgi:hypothetical protein